MLPPRTVQVLGVLNAVSCVEVDGGIQAQLGDAYGGETRRDLPLLEDGLFGPSSSKSMLFRSISSLHRRIRQAKEQAERDG